MCVSQRRWTGCRGRRSPAPPLLLLLLLPLSFLTSTPPLAQGAIHIPPNYKVHNMSQPPVLTEMPISYTAFSREDINLPCEASGNPTPTFRWLKDGQVFGVEHNATGTLRADGDEPLEAFEGRYRCYAANLLGTAMTQAVEVIVEPQPVLLKQHRLLENAREGDSIVLSCNPPNSSTPPNIHWMDKKMVHIQQSDRVMVGLDGNLYFSNLLPGDSKDDYICHAQYSAARTILPVTAVTLSVAPSNNVAGREPSFFRLAGPHSSVLALREQSVTLECIPNGLPTPKVEWKKKDGSLKESTGHLESHNRHLHFRSIALEDDGEYECTATNDHKEIKHSFTVTVEAAPYWVKKPQNLLYAPGETVRLDCQAEGIPTPDITWSMNGVKVTDLTDEPRRSVSGGVLILMDVKFEDTAVFQCEATNKHGSILLNTYLYVIELPPQILSSDGVVYRAIEGGSVRLNCESFGSPRPHVTWSGLDGLHLLSDPRVSLLTNGTVELSDITRNDSGSYVCSVQHTNISITAHLEVFDPTVMLSGPQDVQARRGSSALLDCEFYKDPLLVQHQIIWRKGEHKLLKSAEDDKYTVFENGTLKVTNIQFNDNAHYSCEVITDLDHVRATGSITVVDRPEPPKELSLTPDVNGNVTLSWIPGHSHNSPITEYIVEVREEQHTEAGHWRWEELQRVSGQNNYLQLRLRPFSTYRFRVIAVNLVGESKHSELSEHHSTPPTVPVQNPTNVRSESTDPKTLVITWDEMDRRDHNGPGFMYQVSWREAGAGQWTTREVLAPPLLVNDTGTYTPFDIKVQAVNSLGSGPKPKATIGHSGEEPPEEAPTGLSTNVMNTTVRVLWKPAQNVRGLLQGYKIYVQRLGPSGRSRRSLGKLHHKGEREARSERDRGRDGEEEEVLVVYGGDTWKDVVGLKLYSHYKLTVSVFNSVGESPRSLPHHFHTPEGAPGPPASLRFESPSEKSLILYWTPPVEPNGVLLGYMVQYKQDDSRDSHWEMETISDPANTHFEFTSLDPSSYYIFKVIANTATGDGPPITRRAATLLEGVPPSNITIVSGNTSLNLSWVPGERDRNHGFHIHYLRKSAGSQWQESEVVNSTQGFYSLSGLHPGSQYELMIINGNSTQWKSVAWTMGPVPSEMPGGFAAQGWLIGLISAIVLLVLILLILCLIKRSKGGKYAVKDKEDKEVDSEARPMKDETFGEYRSLESDGDEKRSDSQPSLCGDSKLGSDDSLAEYGDSVDIQFNEDGSFIGQYSGRGPVPHGNESSGPASPVNAVPPPPIAPSMSSILNRPS